MTRAELSVEQLLLQYGDDLFRLAYLLGGDAAVAAQLVQRAADVLSRAGSTCDINAFLAALVAVAPPVRQRNRIPDPLLAALARLPVAERCMLALPVLRTLDELQIPAAITADIAAARALRHRALHTLATELLEPAPGDLFDHTAAPEACRPVRIALANDAVELSVDPALRGHLALCVECRVVAGHWRQCDEQIADR
ncbi:MAG TPA: hypothetical protein PKA05_23275, partial [Roseiflexaceae bacterium]|nr:hypothetical protein [Roseiflexaceae bacterium]